MKRETVEEYLARGGTITKIAPAADLLLDENKVASIPTSSAPSILTLADGGLYYAESKSKKNHPFNRKRINWNAAEFPASLLKYKKNPK